MLDYLKHNKIMAVGAAVAVLAVLYYAFYFGGGAISTPSLSSPSETNLPGTQKLVVMLTSLNTIRLNDSVFKDPVFQSLSDFGVVIPEQQVGRRNPFAPTSAVATPAGQKLPTSKQTAETQQ